MVDIWGLEVGWKMAQLCKEASGEWEDIWWLHGGVLGRGGVHGGVHGGRGGGRGGVDGGGGGGGDLLCTHQGQTPKCWVMWGGVDKMGDWRPSSLVKSHLNDQALVRCKQRGSLAAHPHNPSPQ